MNAGGGAGHGSGSGAGAGASGARARRALVERLFFEAADLRGAARRRFLDEHCADDADLRREVDLLLSMDEHGTEGVLAETPVAAADIPKAISAGAREAETLPKWIGPYKAVRRLGEGGFGLVYLAEQSQPIRRQVALKVIRPGMGSPQVVERFMAERQALALMDHPGVARVFDAGTTDDERPYFAMEYVSGVPITEYARRESLSIRARLELLILVCDAVQHAHQKGVIHRDLKPSNILVEPTGDSSSGTGAGLGRPKVIDFGIAKALAEPLTGQTLQTLAGQLIGTPEYMSPEQAGSAGDVDTRGDVYSLGVVMYELLTGVLPFESARLRSSAMVDIQRIIREEEPPRPSERLRRLTDEAASGARLSLGAGTGLEAREHIYRLRGDLDWITAKAMAKDRDRRYDSAAELAADLRRYLAGEPVLAGPPSAAYRLSKWARKHKTLIAAGSVVTLAVLGGLVGTAWGLDRALREGVRARYAERQARLEAQNALEARGRADQEAQRAHEAEQQARVEAENAVAARHQADAEAERARAEAVSAERVAEFLGDMLRGVGPEVAQGDDTTLLRKILDKAEGEVGDELSGEPLAEARLRRALGAAYHGIQELPKAEANMRRALELFTTTPDATLGEIVSAKHGLAAILHAMDRTDEALPLYQEEFEARLGPLQMPIDAADTLTQIALISYDKNEFDLAATQADRAMALFRENDAADSDSACILRCNMAMIANARGEKERALALYQEALDISERLRGPNHPTTVTARANVASQLGSLGRYGEAVEVLAQCVQDMRRVYGPAHSETITTLSNYGSTLVSLDRLDEAGAAYEEAERLATEHLGESQWVTHFTRYNLGKLAQARHDYETAAAWYRRVVDGLATLWGPSDLDVRFFRNRLSSVLLLGGHAEEALEVARQGIALADEAHAEDDALADALRDAARALLDLGRGDEAGPIITRLKSRAEAMDGRDGRDNRAWAAELSGRTLLGTDNAADAIPEFESSYALWVEGYGAADPDARRVAGRLRDLLTLLGRHDEADTWAAKADPGSSAAQTPTGGGGG